MEKTAKELRDLLREVLPLTEVGHPWDGCYNCGLHQRMVETLGEEGWGCPNCETRGNRVQAAVTRELRERENLEAALAGASDREEG